MARLPLFLVSFCIFTVLGAAPDALGAPSYTRDDLLDKQRVDKLFVQAVGEAQKNAGDFDVRLEAAQLGYFAWRLEDSDNKRRVQIGTLVTKLAKEAIRLKPQHPGGHLWEGAGLAMIGLPKGILNSLQLVPAGKAAFERSIALDDTYMEGTGYALMGHAYAVVPGFPLSIGDKQKAMEYLLKARTMSPSSTMTLLFIADLLWDLGKNKDALRILEELPTKKPKTDLDYFLFETNKRKALEMQKLIKSGGSRDPLYDVMSDISPGLVD